MKRSLGTAAVLALLLVVAPGTLAAAGIGFYPVDFPTLEVETKRSGFGDTTTLNLFGMSGEPRLGSDFDVSATAVGAGFRHYLDHAGDGVYLGGYAGIYWLSGKYTDQDTLARAVMLSAASGYKWTFGGGFFVDVGARLSFPLAADEANDLYDARQMLHDAFGTKLAIGVGYTF